MNDIKIGDKVVVIVSEKQYTTYEDWAISNRLKNWKRGNSCVNGFSGVVTAIGKHGTDCRKTLIAVYESGLEIIIDVEGVKKMKNSNSMKPIKKGMTEAVTRDGRKVTQLTWFDVDSYSDYSFAGVLGGEVLTWTSSGNYLAGCEEDHRDIFAPVEYEYQWLVKEPDGTFIVSTYRSYPESYAGTVNSHGDTWHSRIEESKREVK